jgi:hypothetical protein
MNTDKEQPGTQLPETKRKQIFMALVDAQDQKVPVGKSRQLIAGRYRISESEVQQIEHEGLEANWPPLCRS